MLALFAVDAAVAEAQLAQRVRVQLDGVSGKLEQRIRSVLSIAAAAQQGRLDDAEVRRLHAVAPGEIERALQASGYYRATVQSELREESGQRQARYRIQPGAPTRVVEVSVRVTGPGAEDTSFVRRARVFPLRVGDVLDQILYEQGKQSLAVYAAENGYLDARFDTHRIGVSRDRAEARIALELASGPRFVFGPVTFEPDLLDRRLLASYVPFERSAPVRARDLIELQTKLSEVPYFARVEVQPMRDQAVGNELPIRVTLITRKATRFSSGLGYGTDTGPYLGLGAEWRRINRRGHRAEAAGKLAEIERSVELQYSIPRFAGRDQLLAFSGGYADLRPAASHSRTAQLGVGLLRRRGAWSQVYSLSFKREQFDVGLDAGTSTFLIGEVSGTTVRRDDPIDTHRGHRIQLTARGARRDVLSDISFAQVEALAKVVRGLGRRHRMLARVQAGNTWTDVFADVPATLRYFAGGVQSVRGYDYNTLAPVGADGRVIGGERLLVGSLELELRLLDTWGLASFFDAGNAFSGGTIDLQTGAGFGLRWLSPVGMVRLDAALPGLDRGRRVKFHLNIGPDL